MPFAFFIIGITLIVAGVRNTASDLFTLVKGDFQGDNNYIRWVVAILILGSLGYIDQLKTFSRAFLFLIIVTLFLKNGRGFFDQFNKAISSNPNLG